MSDLPFSLKTHLVYAPTPDSFPVMLPKTMAGQKLDLTQYLQAAQQMVDWAIKRDKLTEEERAEVQAALDPDGTTEGLSLTYLISPENEAVYQSMATQIVQIALPNSPVKHNPALILGVQESNALGMAHSLTANS